ncbi:hypothetical protein SeMB42_g00156 [Synchytrium endobioticum]|uniref:Uncharacterized protein n=1 Tax=Synchytrium endobioticum TaxID=286115 RepID=A0A507DTW2_9FUNG|nr:hypothetical protein SeMB42_g00156 [Synchytrium endobioticum]
MSAITPSKLVTPGWPSEAQLHEFHELHFGASVKSQFQRALGGTHRPQRTRCNDPGANDNIPLCTRCKTHMSYSIWHQHQTHGWDEENGHAVSINDDTDRGDGAGIRIELTNEMIAIFKHSEEYKRQRVLERQLEEQEAEELASVQAAIASHRRMHQNISKPHHIVALENRLNDIYEADGHMKRKMIPGGFQSNY